MLYTPPAKPTPPADAPACSQPTNTTAGVANSAPSTAPHRAPAAARRGSEESNARQRRLIRHHLHERIDPLKAANLDSDTLRSQIDALIRKICDEQRLQLSRQEEQTIGAEMHQEMVGLGPIQPLLADDSINDILVNGAGQVYVERNGRLELTNVVFTDEEHVLNTAQRIAAGVGRRIDESQPMVDARLADGSRVNIITHPLAIDGTTISIRKFMRRHLTLDGLVERGALSPPMGTLLKRAMRARLNIVISGGTGAGKTTLLNALSQRIDAADRIITIEDAAELQLQQAHVVRLETRPVSAEGTGRVDQRDLVRNALRMRPDRIILGEVRGGESFDMLQAMNTGHDGSLCTVHANTPRDAVMRLENMVMMADMPLPMVAIRRQIASAVDLIIQIARLRDGSRRVVALAEVCGMENDVIQLQGLYTFRPSHLDGQGRLQGEYAASGQRPHFYAEHAHLFEGEADA
jgi:pilus assembly protein CpaF